MWRLRAVTTDPPRLRRRGMLPVTMVEVTEAVAADLKKDKKFYRDCTVFSVGDPCFFMGQNGGQYAALYA